MLKVRDTSAAEKCPDCLRIKGKLGALIGAAAFPNGRYTEGPPYQVAAIIRLLRTMLLEVLVA